MSAEPLPPRPHLKRYSGEARDLFESFSLGHPKLLQRVRQHHPGLPGRRNTNDRNPLTDAAILSAGLSLADARAVIAHEHHFASWPKFANHIAALNRKGSAVARFEAGADAIVTGDEATLKRVLRASPKLIQARSDREHRATLLHYTAANAVESYRQKTPKNIVRIAKILLETGAEVDVDLDYGTLRKRYPERTGSTTLGLAATSCHPAIAGVQIPLLEILIRYGACVDGIPGGWNPVIAALHNGRGAAAAYLAKRGARLDLEGAAGVGRLEVVKSFFNRDGSLKSNATEQQRDLGCMWACQYGDASVVDALMEMGVDVSAQPHGETALHWAAYGGHAAVVKILLKHSAPPNAKDRRFNGTTLGWALYGWCDAAPEADRNGYYEVVSRLIAAGATVEPEWLAKSQRGFPIATKVRSDKRMLRALKGQRLE